MVAGVFSTCKKVLWGETTHQTYKTGCCKDPAVYDRISDEIKDWIRKTAPGVRDSRGCPPKKSKVKVCKIDVLCNCLKI